MYQYVHRMCRDSGCDDGYHYCMPVPFAECPESTRKAERIDLFIVQCFFENRLCFRLDTQSDYIERECREASSQMGYAYARKTML